MNKQKANRLPCLERADAQGGGSVGDHRKSPFLDLFPPARVSLPPNLPETVVAIPFQLAKEDAPTPRAG